MRGVAVVVAFAALVALLGPELAPYAPDAQRQPDQPRPAKRRLSLPVAVLGRAATNSTRRGYL